MASIHNLSRDQLLRVLAVIPASYWPTSPINQPQRVLVAAIRRAHADGLRVRQTLAKDWGIDCMGGW